MGNIAFRMEIAAVLAVAAVMTACEKGGETVENGSPECEAFLAAATEYGLYGAEQRAGVHLLFPSTERRDDSRTLRGYGVRSESRQCRIRGGEDGRHEGVAMVRDAGTGHRS